MNLFIFMTDQQRGDSILPGVKALTPHLDRFNRDAVLFTSAFTTAPHCCPSRASFFSGEHPAQHNVWNNVNVSNALSREPAAGTRFFSHELSDAGYDCRFYGKWHISDFEGPGAWGFGHDRARDGEIGFPVWRGREGLPEAYEWKMHYGEAPRKNPPERGKSIRRPGYPDFLIYGPDEDPFYDRSVVDEVIADLEEQPGNRPWCYYAGTLGPHDPYIVPKRFLDLYPAEDMELPPSFSDRMEDKPGLYRRTRDRFDKMSEEEHKECLRHYLAFCSYEDYLFGLCLEALEKKGALEDTMVIYTSDHGDYTGDHGLWSKGLPHFNGAYNIPLSIRIPGGTAGQVDELVSITDCAPTILDMAGIVPDGFKTTGRSLRPWLEGKSPDTRREYHFTQTNGNELYGIQRAVHSKQWKLVYNGFDYDELYDLEKDPEQLVNLAGRPEYEDITKELYRALWTFAEETGDKCINPYIATGLAQYGPGIIRETV